MTKSSGEFVSIGEAARLLGVTPPTVQEWTEKGFLQAWKTPGGHRRIVRSSLEALLAQRAEAMRQPHRPPPTVLLVESDPERTAPYRHTLAAWRPPVALICASNGFEALIQVGRHPPDLLITDLELEGMDGLELVRTLRHHPELKRIQIVVATDLPPDQIAQRGGLPPEVTPFPKPFPLAELEQMVQRLAGGQPGRL